MKIMTVANHITMLEELEKELSNVFPKAEIIKETDSLMAGKYVFNQKVDIVFAEADMKRMNGIQLIQFVKQEHPGVKSFIIGTEKELSKSFLTVSEDVTEILTYPFAKNAILDAWQRSR